MEISKRILIIDDDADIRDVLSQILMQEGYTIVEHSSGREIYNIIWSIKPDLIILDVMLNGTDGRDICRKLKQHKNMNSIPVMVISAGYGLRAMKEKECGADEYLAKPFDIDDLLLKVRQLLFHIKQ